MKEFEQDIVGRKCRPIDSPSGDFYYTVVAAWIDAHGAGDLVCAVISVAGGANVIPFLELRFESATD